MELVCPAGTASMMRAAVAAGADSVYCGMADETNARNFPGLNFTPDELADAVRWCSARRTKVLFAANTFAPAGRIGSWQRSVDAAVAAGVHAVIAADIAVLAHMRDAHPDTRLHLSVQAGAATPEAIGFYAREYGVKRVVLPRVLNLTEIAELMRGLAVETEAFAFGGLCVMAEGRCALSSYVAGRSPNQGGVCSPPDAVEYRESGGHLAARLDGLMIGRYAAGEPAGYPTLCKGCFRAEGRDSHLFEDPVSLNALPLLGSLRACGVTALKLEGRQRGKAYVARITAAFRAALDGGPPGPEGLSGLAEGGCETAGAYKRGWR